MAIQARLKQEEASKAAMKDAEALAAKLDAEKPKAGSELLLDFADAKTVSALGAEGLPGLVAQSVLNTGVSELPKAKVVGLGNTGYAVAWVKAVHLPRKLKPKLIHKWCSITRILRGRCIRKPCCWLHGMR